MRRGPRPIAWIAARPLAVLGAGLLAALAAALALVLTGDERLQLMQLYYHVPIAVPFTAFVLDRINRWPSLDRWALLLDLEVVALALARMVIPLPWISGHALFLTYAPLTTRCRVTQISALVVMLQVMHVKWLLRDATLFGGVALGCIAAWALTWIQRDRHSASHHLEKDPHDT